MRRLPVLAVTIIIAAALAAAPAARAAGLDLTLNACNTDGGVDAFILDCNSSSSQVQLIGCLQMPTAVDSVVGVDISLDVEVEAASLPDFWRFETCNASGLLLSLGVPLTGCSGVPGLWGAGGAEGDQTRAYLSFYGGSPTRGRLIASLFRISGDPVDLAAGANTFAFALRISTLNATEAGGTCPGCATPTVIYWNSAEVQSDAVSQPDPITIINAGLVGQCVRLNGANVATCAATPTRPSTWGRLKALYR